jgi:hypothetical protein
MIARACNGMRELVPVTAHALTGSALNLHDAQRRRPTHYCEAGHDLARPPPWLCRTAVTCPAEHPVLTRVQRCRPGRRAQSLPDVKDRSTWNALVLAASLGSQVGSHRRPTPAYVEATQEFDSCDLTCIEQRSAMSGDGRDLVRIKGV